MLVPLLVLACVLSARVAVAADRYGIENWRVISGQMTPVGNSQVRVEGSTRLSAETSSDDVTLDFTYLGPSQRTEPLASGELRRQIGLRLRAPDVCNVINVMWWIEPAPTIQVTVKRNPGLSTHAECLDHGYSVVAPEAKAVVATPRIVPGMRHRLRGRLTGRRLEVWADRRLVWAGVLPAAAIGLRGPAGLRTDNGDFVVSATLR